MRTWAANNLTPSEEPIRVLECGSGNGTLLLSLLTWPKSEPQAFHLTGIDYSEGAVDLGARVEQGRRTAIEEGDEDVLDPDDVVNPATCEWRQGDLLRDDIAETWDLVMDKGTFDALALSQEPVKESGDRLPSRVYPERVARLVKPGGFFLITSCNFTVEEVIARFTVPGLGEFGVGDTKRRPDFPLCCATTQVLVRRSDWTDCCDSCVPESKRGHMIRNRWRDRIQRGTVASITSCFVQAL